MKMVGVGRVTELVSYLGREPESPLAQPSIHMKEIHTEIEINAPPRAGVAGATHDVEVALYLSRRIYAFSSHPGRVKREVKIPFGEQRTRAIQRDPTFLDLREEVQSLFSTE